MDTSSGVATWLSFAVTAIGLGGLISQISIINDKLDPFHANRSPDYLGSWYGRQEKLHWWQALAKPPLLGPTITAGLTRGFCGKQILYLTRSPSFERPGKAGWAMVLATFHAEDLSASTARSTIQDHVEMGAMSARTADRNEEGRYEGSQTEWKNLEKMDLILHQRHACVTISRASFITIMVTTNARSVFSHSDASGFRAGYASYTGQWYLTWPIGQEAVVHYAAHDSHSVATDVYPRTVKQRVDRCTQMIAGIISAPGDNLQIAFCGRKSAGSYVLEYDAKGFPGAHGARHLYNMLGGRVFDVDFLKARKVDASLSDDSCEDYLRLDVPSRDGPESSVIMFVPEKERAIIAHATDCLPWNHLSWSVHRGLRDVMLAFAKPVMDTFRSQLACLFKQTVANDTNFFIRRGWEVEFVYTRMGDMAASAVLAGQGDSGDLVRVVTDIMLANVRDWRLEDLDNTTFWRAPRRDQEMNMAAAVALTKVFVLEWSTDFDYQIYHNLPTTLLFA